MFEEVFIRICLFRIFCYVGMTSCVCSVHIFQKVFETRPRVWYRACVVRNLASFGSYWMSCVLWKSVKLVVFCAYVLCVTHCALCEFVFDVFDFAWDNMLIREQNGAIDSTTEAKGEL